jgi:predicted dehydrogenase
MAAVMGATLYRHGATIAAIASRRPESAEALARKLGSGIAYSSVATLLDSDSVDIVYIAATNDTHCAIAEAALRRGIAVLCEKPLGLDEQEVAHLVGLSTTLQVPLLEALWTAYLPSFVRLRQALAEQEIGRPVFARSDFGFVAEFDPASRLFDPARGGGCLNDLGPYPMLLATIALGDPLDAFAIGRFGPTGVDHHVAAMIDFGESRVAQFVCSFEMPTIQTAEIFSADGAWTLSAPFWRCDALGSFSPRARAAPMESPYLGGSVPRLSDLDATYSPQVIEMTRCWKHGLIESPLLTHEDSMRVARGLDHVRRRLHIARASRIGD